MVICETLERGDTLRDNHVYVIVTDVVVAKRVQQIREENEAVQLRLISDNGTVYKPYEVDISDIRQILKVKCRLTLKLIRTFLRSPIQINGKLQKRTKGVPQGSPLSPLLSNIMLNELDKLLVARGHRYIRYADDFSIYTKSKSEARKVGNKIYQYLKFFIK